MSRLEKKKQLSMRHSNILATDLYHKYSAIQPVLLTFSLYNKIDSFAIFDPKEAVWLELKWIL